MIVTCDECQTVFKVDDSRIPAKGIRVRCSKCKHIFMVKPEVPEDLQTEYEDFEQFHRDALKGEAPESGDEKPPDRADESVGISFEEFMRGQEPPPESEEKAVPEEGAGFGELGEQPPEGAEPPEEEHEPVSEEPAGITFEEFMRQEEPESVPGEGEPEAEEEIPTSVQEREELSEEDLGTGGIDLEFSPTPETSEARDASPEEESPGEKEPELSMEAFLKEEMEQESAGRDREAVLASVKEKKFEDLMRGKRRAVRQRSSLRFILFLILILVVAGGVYLWWQNREASTNPLAQIGSALGSTVAKVSDLWEEIIGFRKEDLVLGDLQGYEDMIGSHRIYVIKGHVRNESNKARRYVKLRVVILDQAGNRIKDKVIFCGNVFTREELEQLAPVFITGDETLQPKRPKDMVVGPDQTIGFMAIFSGLPREGKSFRIEKLEAPAV